MFSSNACDAPEELRAIVAKRRVLICTTPTVHALYGERMRNLLVASALAVDTYVMPVDEGSKDAAAVLALCERAHHVVLGRRDVMVALGGGVCSDLVRLAASLIRRGIAHVCIPTTLIGQIDAGIGIKAGINFDGAKSYLGSFTPPQATFIDPGLLDSLGADALRDGLAEAVKLAVSLDADLFARIERHGAELIASRFGAPEPEAVYLLARSIALTCGELGKDLHETGPLRRLLDFGHTFSPVIEAESGFAISHGAAVAIDICLSCYVAVALGRLDRADAARIVAAVAKLGLPTDARELTPASMAEAVAAAARHRDGAPNLVIPDAIGRGGFVTNADELSEDVLTDALAMLRGEGDHRAPVHSRFELAAA